ncbi:hypothetical protein BVC80_9019g17 [Macleaya cordata]|uniref:Uncharacterized protein n=1 Tax=Macleaya cordata TaxID=56857 RepID=A0A200QQI9_MACCD|nr:hypothetical protein BVC80_9019g17 [Macleaya cordata]
MAAMSIAGPVPINNITETSTTVAAAASPAPAAPATAIATATASPTTTTTTPHAPKSLRGLNKPKCSKCGNVARSRCPYQSCKSCCAKAQNPCHIHVLKSNATFPDKTSPSSSPLFDQQTTDVSSTGASLRASALRQLSQFNGSQVPRAKRPLTRKDAAALNQWRFSKLREYKEINIETENEAFDRYMQNVSLLEEAFSVNSSVEGPTSDGPMLDPTTNDQEDINRKIISGLKAKLRSSPRRADSLRVRIQGIVDQGLRKLQKLEVNDEAVTTDANDLDSEKELKRPKKAKNVRAERFSAVNDLIDKLKKARNEDDLQSCLRMKSQLFNQHDKAYVTESKVFETSNEQIAGNDSIPRQDLPPKCFSKAEISQETLHTIDVHFTSLDEIEDL